MDIEAFKMLHSLKFNIPSAFTQQNKLKVIDDEEEEKYRSDE